MKIYQFITSNNSFIYYVVNGEVIGLDGNGDGFVPWESIGFSSVERIRAVEKNFELIAEL